jgi:hypothetical protein
MPIPDPDLTGDVWADHDDYRTPTGWVPVQDPELTGRTPTWSDWRRPEGPDAAAAAARHAARAALRARTGAAWPPSAPDPERFVRERVGRWTEPPAVELPPGYWGTDGTAPAPGAPAGPGSQQLLPNPWIDPDDDALTGCLPYGEVPG